MLLPPDTEYEGSLAFGEQLRSSVGVEGDFMKLRESVVKRLSESPGEQLKARDLAEWLVETYPDVCAKKAEKSGLTNPQLLNQLVAEIGSNRPAWMKKHPQLNATAERPRLYYWSEKTDQQTVEEAETVSTLYEGETLATLPAEHALYGPVIEFFASEFRAFAMRIDEKTASNRRGTNGNKWLFPDLCAMESLIEGLDADVTSLVTLTGGKKAFLYSIEVKVVLNSSNVREAFFQTVSNSSWANYGYLVAAQVDVRVMDELRMLHGLHGTGVIQLSVDNPSDSQVLIPARLSDQLDWKNINRLTEENPDFRTFAMRVKHFYQTNNVTASGWKA